MRRFLTVTALACLLLGFAGCSLDPTVREAKAATKEWGSYLTGDSWKKAGEMTAPDIFAWEPFNQNITHQGNPARLAYINGSLKPVGGTLLVHIKDSTKTADDKVVVQVEFQARVGDANRPANLFWKSALTWQKFSSGKWGLVRVKDLSAPERKQGY